MSNNVLNPQQQFKDDAGVPLTAGSLTFTDDGTNDANTEVFSDEALTVQVVTAGGVYTLDAAGRTRGNVIFKGRRRMTLKNAAGAKIKVYDAVVSSSSVANTTEYELGSVAAVHTHSGIITGHIININFKDTNRTLGSGGSFRHDGSTDGTKAGNWPDADGFNYDADGKKFVEVSQSETLTSPDGNTTITLANGTITIKISSADDFEFIANILRAKSGSVFETNTINETTSASGVTIDSVLLKDGNFVPISGKGIDFSATSDASGQTSELFDDYEEGTWTPTIQDDTLSDSEGQVYSVQVGKYTKIGNRVFFNFRIIITDLGTMTAGDGAIVAGLPFTSESTSNNQSGVNIVFATSLAIPNASENLSGSIVNNSTVILLNLWDAVQGTTFFLISELSVGAILVGTGHYEV